MADSLVSGGEPDDDAHRASTDSGRAARGVTDPAQRAATARFEREVAALDLADAAQAASRAASTSESGAEADTAAQSDLAARLYASADRHRHVAEMLDAHDSSPAEDAERLETNNSGPDKHASTQDAQ